MIAVLNAISLSIPYSRSSRIVAPSRTPRLPIVIGKIFVNKVIGKTSYTIDNCTVINEFRIRKLVNIDSRNITSDNKSDL